MSAAVVGSGGGAVTRSCGGSGGGAGVVSITDLSETPRMKITWAIPCRYAEPAGNGLTNILGGGMDVFRFESFDDEGIDLRLAVNIIVPEHEIGQTRILTADVFDPAMQSTRGGEIAFRMEDHPNRPEARQPSDVVILTVRFATPAPGQYTIVLSLDGSSVSVPIFALPA